MNRLLASVSLAASLFATTSSAAVINATPANFVTQLALARGGDTLVLGPGLYDKLAIKRQVFSPALNLVATGATIRQGVFLEVAGLNVTGGTWNNGCPVGVSCSIPALDVYGSKDVTLTNAAVVGPEVIVPGQAYVIADGYGVRITNSSFIKIATSVFSNLKTAVPVGKSSDIVVNDIRCKGMRSDCVSMGQVWRVRVENIVCDATRILSTEHPDCVQFWSRPDTLPTSDVVVRGVRAFGDTDGILFSDKAQRLQPAGFKLADGTVLTVATLVPDGGFDRVLVENNEVDVTFANGVSMNNARDSWMKNNHVRTIPGSSLIARFVVTPEVKTCGNSYTPYLNKAGLVQTPC